MGQHDSDGGKQGEIVGFGGGVGVNYALGDRIRKKK